MKHHRLCVFLRQINRKFSSNLHAPKVAIVGGGPAGFYTAQHILKAHVSAQVDVYEKLPVPFGLVRFGVAPDHPEVKNVISTFTKTALHERCRFLGNVSVGRDISLAELQDAYSAVVLSYGADEDRLMDIPGEDLRGVYSARAFVGWYNGLPDHKHLKPVLDTDTAVIIGQGNVAVDVARMLLTPVDILRKTDMTEYALDALSESRVRRVFLVGRRGPLQVAFTTAELREMLKLPHCRPLFDKTDFLGLQEQQKRVVQKRRRLSELLIRSALEPAEQDVTRWQAATREWQLKFLRSPLEILPSADGKSVSAIKLAVNVLSNDDEIEKKTAIRTEMSELIECGLVLRSIGYKSIPIDGVAFDKNKSIIANTRGRVQHQTGVYCSGWVKRGPVGVIVSTMTDAFETAALVCQDLDSGLLPVLSGHQGSSVIVKLLRDRGIRPVSFSDWQRIDEQEVKRGKILGKSREKICEVENMLNLVNSPTEAR